MLQPHAAIPLLPLVPEFRQVRRAQLRKTDFEQFGYTDNCPGCANARAGRKQAVDHSEQCRVRVERILETTTEGHERLERARDRFAQAAKEPGVDEPQRKRHRPVGEGWQPLAPPVSHAYQEGSSSGSGALPPPPPSVPPSLESSLAKRGLEQATEMTDANVEQQGESKRRREYPEVPQVSNSSSSSSSSTDTEMGLVDVCTIHENESRGEAGLRTLDLTKWDFHRADCRNKCRKLVENSKPLLLIGSPMDSGREDKERVRAVLHLASCTKHHCTEVCISFKHTHILQTQLGTVNSCGFHEQ